VCVVDRWGNGSRTLPAGDLDRRAEAPLRFSNVRRVLYQQQFTFDVM
jgi:hypothetical protein